MPLTNIEYHNGCRNRVPIQMNENREAQVVSGKACEIQCSFGLVIVSGNVRTHNYFLI